MQITRPFEIINQATDYDVRCSVKGGGPTGQAGAHNKKKINNT